MIYRKLRARAAVLAIAVSICAGLPSLVQAQDADEDQPATTRAAYHIRPGDMLQISVWKEDYLQRDVLVRPDGGISFPLAGDVIAADRTVIQIRDALAGQLSRYIPDPVVTVAVKEIRGNMIYVLGQVQKPGPFVMNPRVDILQALAMAGGATPFAALNDIKILRRNSDGQEAIDFRYSDVIRGRRLEQNILLQGGDIIVVP